MRDTVLWIVLAVVLIFVNLSIIDKEKTLRDGDTVILQLAPVDPRSLLQGDYMQLRYAIAIEALPAAQKQGRDGTLIVSLDDRNIARFVRIDDGAALAAHERRLVYRVRAAGLRLATDAYFFQEGHGDVYENARYGKVKVGDDGAAVLVGLLDENLKPLGAT